MIDEMALRFDLGATWLNLLGSRGHNYGPHPYERMTGPDKLREWLDHERLTPATQQIGEADLALARELRTTLTALLVAALHQEPTPPEHLATLNRFLAADEPIELTADLRAEPPRTVLTALARVARQAAEHLTGPELADIRQCPDTECQGALLDPTGRRRWCSNERCGVKARVRAHRARKQSAAE